MRIGTIGAGHIGSTLARLLIDAGHDVAVSNSRGPETLRELVAELGDRATALTVEEASRFGDIVIVSIPFGRYRELAPGTLAEKVVIDTNNYYPQRDGHFEELDASTRTSSELLQDHLADARVVKAFNTINWAHLRDHGRPDGDPNRIGIPISGDDADAKSTVAELIDEIGFDAVDAGPLGAGGRQQQPGSDIYGADLRTEELRAQLGR
jgi:predicted dinucleotide-binding enzyme